MVERSPIFSAKQNNQRIGYIEGDAAFDLLGRRRANYSAKSGNLRALNSGRIVGYVSLQGKFVGASWLADELFPNPDELVQQQGPPSDSGLVVEDETFRQRNVDNLYAVDVHGGNARVPFDRSSPALELSSRSSDDAGPVALRERHSNLRAPIVASEIFGKKDDEEVCSSPSADETPSGYASVQGDPVESDDHSREEVPGDERYSDDPGPVAADRIFEQRGVEGVHPVAGANAAITSSSRLSEKGELPILEISETAQTSEPEQGTFDPTKGFFEVDVERAIGMVWNELGKEVYRNDPQAVFGDATQNPAKDPFSTEAKGFFSAEIEHKAEPVQTDLGKKGYPTNPEADAAGGELDPTKDFFAVDVERAVGMVRRALAKGSL